MATYQSTSARHRIPARTNNGENIVFDQVDVTSPLASGDILEFFYLPKGAKIVGFTGYSSADLDTDFLGSGSLGLPEDPDLFRDAPIYTISTNTVINLYAYKESFGYKVQADSLISATITGIGTGATGSVLFCVAYLFGTPQELG